jgi:putative transposase
MPAGLKRFHGGGDLHFITFSCYHRMPLLSAPASRDVFLSVLEKTRQKYEFEIAGYVVMPEHVHLLVSEPENGTLSTAVQVVKQQSSRLIGHSSLRCAKDGAPGVEKQPVWQTRFYDFNVWTEDKRIEKLRYIHRNPVTRGLVAKPEEWRWSSYRFYALGEEGSVGIGKGVKIG